MCCKSCRDTSEPSEIPSSTSTVWVRIGGMASGRPAIAAIPTAVIAPEINPPGRFAQRNITPPAAPTNSVSSRLRVLVRLGMANAIDAGIWLTAPYGKSLHRGQLRQRDCSNARGLGDFSARMNLSERTVGGRTALLQSLSSYPAEAGYPVRRGFAIYRCCSGILDHPLSAGDDGFEGRVTRSRSLRLVSRGLLAFGHEILSFLAVDALGIGFLRAFERCCGPRLLGLLFRRRHFCSRFSLLICRRRFGCWCRSGRRGGLRKR